MPGIIESPVLKMVYRDHLWIWILVLTVMKRGRLEGDVAAVSIHVPNVVGITFFPGIEILECIYFWWCWLRTSFNWLSMWPFFFGMVPLVSVLPGFVSGSLFWERLWRLMLYSMEASTWWYTDTSASRLGVLCVEIFWRSSKSWWMMLSLPAISFLRCSAWISLFSYDIVISFSHLFLKVLTSFDSAK